MVARLLPVPEGLATILTRSLEAESNLKAKSGFEFAATAAVVAFEAPNSAELSSSEFEGTQIPSEEALGDSKSIG